MFRSLLLAGFLLSGLAHAGTAYAQSAALATGERVFARQYPEAAATLNAIPVAFATLFEELHAQPGAPITDATLTTLLDDIRSGSPGASSAEAAMPTFASYAPEVANILQWGDEFERALYEVYADDRVSDKRAAVDQLITRYLSRGDRALPDLPKIISVADQGHGMEGHAMMNHHAVTLESAHPKVNGLIWASAWLQIAVLDPLIFYPTAAQKRAGVEDVADRFRVLTDEMPANFPTQRPTPAAIAPALYLVHPRAAAIIDNHHLFRSAVADILVSNTAGGKREALNSVVSNMQDAEHMAAEQYDWFLASVRRGIFFQGGPAIGSLESSERNRGAHDPAVHDMSMPGMGM